MSRSSGFVQAFFVFCLWGCSLLEVPAKRDPGVYLRFVSPEGKRSFWLPQEPGTRRDLLEILAERSRLDDPSLRFVSTNRSEEIMEVDGLRSTWKEGWVVYKNGLRIFPEELKRGIGIRVGDQIEIRFEPMERTFGRPMPTANGG